MVADKGTKSATEMDYPAHHRNYDGFLRMLKYGSVITAVITAIVIYIIAN